MLSQFLAAADLDWAGFFPFSEEAAPPRSRSTARSTPRLMHERLRECSEIQDPITAAARAALVGETVEVLVDGRDDDGARRPHLPRGARRSTVSSASWGPKDDPGATVRVRVTDAIGPDLEACVIVTETP